MVFFTEKSAFYLLARANLLALFSGDDRSKEDNEKEDAIREQQSPQDSDYQV